MSGQVKIELYVAGNGTTYPKAGDIVTVDYIGYFLDGTEFDSTHKRGKPFKFMIGSDQVFYGLEYSVTQLSVGERAKAEIPPQLAFGEKGFPHLVPPNTTIILDITLLSIISS